MADNGRGEHMPVIGVRKVQPLDDTVREEVVAMAHHAFEEPAVIDAIYGPGDRLTPRVQDVQGKMVPVRRRAQPGLVPSLIDRVREVAVIVVGPCHDVAFIDFPLEIGQQALRPIRIKIERHDRLLRGVRRPNRPASPSLLRLMVGGVDQHVALARPQNLTHDNLSLI
jgi:hypothetical protein